MCHDKCTLCDSETNLDDLAKEIAGYLSQHPEASDSVQGIARWWLTRQRLEVAINAVGQALELLEQNEVVEKYDGPGLVTYYRRRATRQ